MKHVVDNCIRSYKERLAQKEKLIQVHRDILVEVLKMILVTFGKGNKTIKEETKSICKESRYGQR